MTITAEARRTEQSGTGSEATFTFPWRIITNNDITVYVTDSSAVETLQVLTTDYTITGLGDATGDVVFVTPPGATDTVIIYIDPPATQLVDYSAGGPFPAESHEGALDTLTLIVKRALDLVSRALGLSDGTIDGSGSYDINGNVLRDVAEPTLSGDGATKGYVDGTVASAVLDPTTPVTAWGAALIDDTSFDAMLVTLGAGSKGIPIFKDDTDAAVLTELGITSFIQTLLTKVTVADVHQYLETIPKDEINRENLVVNGDFQVWQNGTTFTGPNDATYTADQFVIVSDGNAVVDVAEYAFSSNQGNSGITITQKTGKDNLRWGLVHPIEYHKTKGLRGYSLSGSVSAVGSGDLTDMRFRLISWDPTISAPDAPTLDPILSWATGAQVEPTLNTGWSYVTGGDAAVAITGGWNTFSFDNATCPTGAENLALILYTNDASFTFAGGAEINISEFQLVADSEATEFRSKPFTQEIADCQRFFAKTFPQATTPADAIGSILGALAEMTGGHGGNAEWCAVNWRFPTPMVAVPTITTYNPGSTATTAGEWNNAAGTDDKTGTIVATGADATTIYMSEANSVSNTMYYIHATADSRF
jgi:hypothetical protein